MYERVPHRLHRLKVPSGGWPPHFLALEGVLWPYSLARLPAHSHHLDRCCGYALAADGTAALAGVLAASAVAAATSAAPVRSNTCESPSSAVLGLGYIREQERKGENVLLSLL